MPIDNLYNDTTLACVVNLLHLSFILCFHLSASQLNDYRDQQANEALNTVHLQYRHKLVI